MPRTSISRTNKRQPTLFDIFVRGLLRQRQILINQIREIDEQISEALRNDNTVQSYGWLQVLQAALNESTVDLNHTHIEYPRPDQVPTIIAQADQLDLAESQTSSSQSSFPFSQPFAQILTDKRTPNPDPKVVIEPVKTTPIEKTTAFNNSSRVYDLADSLVHSTPNPNESILSDNFLRFLDPNPSPVYPTPYNPEEVREYLNILSDDNKESNPKNP